MPTDPRVDHIEDELEAKLPGYVRYVPAVHEAPAPPTGLSVTTAPGTATLSWQGVPDATAYASIHVDAAGNSSPPIVTTDLSVVFNGLAPGAYTFAVQSVRDGAVSDWAKTTGTVPVVTPTPTPPPPDNGYTIPDGAKTLPAGSSLSGLAPGNYVLEGGDYKAPGGTLAGVNLYAAVNRQSFWRGGAAQTFIKGGGIHGVMGDGLGKAPKLNDFAAIILQDGANWIQGGWTHALGVALAGDGSNIVVNGAWLLDNGSAGVGGKMDDSLVTGCLCKGNNVKVRDSDGAVLGKFTRSNRIAVVGNIVAGGPNAGIWFDISNGPGTVAENTIRDISLLKSDKPWTAVGIKLEISFPGWVVRDNDVAGTGSYCIDCNETYDVQIYGNKLEESPASSDGGVLGLRNLHRSDTPSTPPNAWVLGKIDFHHNVMTKGYGTVTGSGAGDKISLAKFNITVHDNVGDVRYQNVKP